MAIVTWDIQAVETRIALLEYGAENFGPITAKKFSEEIDRLEKFIALNPESGFIEPLLQGLGRLFRGKNFKKHFRLIFFYDEEKDNVHIVDIWDTRMAPKTLIKRIK
ncbi:MAG: type II toxin-antitoxin system RelE/ParE family toxin [Prevotella sp.]|nr:type II toxin-antitoxin system RelE/ParE family toxin [Prevotella sp.]